LISTSTQKRLGSFVDDPLTKPGLFGSGVGIYTRILNNKPRFSGGVNQAIRRTTVRICCTLGRVRGHQPGRMAICRNARAPCSLTNTPGTELAVPAETPTPTFYRLRHRTIWQAFQHPAKKL